MGYVTGPRRSACPPQASEWQRFLAASYAIAYHEGAIVLTLALLWWLTAGGNNMVGATTFMLLWLMRLSTKINIFLGVPNPAAELLPPRLGYLKGYFRQAPMNWFFPVSVTLATLATAWFALRAGAAPASGFEGCSSVLLMTLSALGLIEHWFLVLPFRADALWGWSLPPQAEPAKSTVSLSSSMPAPQRQDRLCAVTSAVV